MFVTDEKFWYEHLPETDMYRVWMSVDGVSSHCHVSSMHLIDEKRGQLREACLRKSYEAFDR